MNSQKAHEKLEQFSVKYNLATIQMKSKTKNEIPLKTIKMAKMKKTFENTIVNAGENEATKTLILLGNIKGYNHLRKYELD